MIETRYSVGKCQMRVYDDLKADSEGHSKRTTLLTCCRVKAVSSAEQFPPREKKIAIVKSKGLETASMKSSSFPTGVLYIFSWGHCLRHCFPSGVLESSKEQKAWANSVQWDMILTLFSFLLWQLYNRPNEECMYCVITHLLKFSWVLKTVGLSCRFGLEPAPSPIPWSCPGDDG